MILKLNGNSNFDLSWVNTEPRPTLKLRAGFFFYYSLLILIFVYFLFFSGKAHKYFKPNWYVKKFEKNKNSKNFYIKIHFTRRNNTIFFKTLQRAPMAHRQWSQEQYELRFYSYKLEVKQKIQLNRPAVNINKTTNKSLPLFFKPTPKFLFNTSLINFNNLLFVQHYNCLFWKY